MADVGSGSGLARKGEEGDGKDWTAAANHQAAVLQRKNWSHVADTGKAARSITVSLAFYIFEGDSG